MKCINKNAGMTLIEILGTIIILSIAMMTVSSILINGISFSNKVSNTNALQQHGNYVLAALQKQHEQGKDYTIDATDPKKIIVSIPNKNDFIIDDPRFNYFLFKDGSSEEIKITKIDPTSEKNVKMKVLIKNSDGSPGEYEIQTTLSRL